MLSVEGEDCLLLGELVSRGIGQTTEDDRPVQSFRAAEKNREEGHRRCVSEGFELVFAGLTLVIVTHRPTHRHAARPEKRIEL